jgi:hypothetical protein
LSLIDPAGAATAQSDQGRRVDFRGTKFQVSIVGFVFGANPVFVRAVWASAYHTADFVSGPVFAEFR